jgi:3'(2'), 5'-bisphosphate nucleotidase
MLNQIDIQDIVAIAKEAGNVIMQVYKQDFEVEYKQDSSPLTLADKKANDIIEDGLNQLSVNLPILSEEGNNTPYKDRKHWEYFWLVDPLDGTKEFVKKNGEFTVNIALIHKDAPVLGVIYAPALDMCYWSKQGEGAYKDGKNLPLKTGDQRNTYKIVVSRSHMSDETQAFIDAIDTDKAKELISIGSSLKLVMVAEGSADIYPRLAPTMEWDTAAADAIVRESGKMTYQYDSTLEISDLKPVIYNKENLLNPWFIVRKIYLFEGVNQ